MATKTPHRTVRAIAGLGAVVLAIGLVAAACGGDDDTDSTTTAAALDQTGNLDLIEEQTLTVCSDIPYLPFEFEKEDAPGEYTGFDVELVDSMAERLDLKTAWRVTVFDTILASLEAGDCDVVASAMTITDERKEQVAFTEPYFDSEQSLLVTKENETKYATLEDLAGQTIGVQSGTTGETYAQEHLPPGAELKSFDTGEEIFAPLAAGEVAAVLQDYPVNAYRALQDDQVVVTETFPTDEQYGFAVRQDNSELLEALNGALADVRGDGTYDEIYATWFGERKEN